MVSHTCFSQKGHHPAAKPRDQASSSQFWVLLCPPPSNLTPLPPLCLSLPSQNLSSSTPILCRVPTFPPRPPMHLGALDRHML